MARTSGKAFIVIDKLEENKLVLRDMISEIKDNRTMIRGEMLSLIDDYTSSNSALINTKIEEIDNSIKNFINGEEKIVNILLPDVNRRFHLGAAITLEKAKEIKSTNKADIRIDDDTIMSDIVNEYSKMKAKKKIKISESSNLNNYTSVGESDSLKINKYENMGNISKILSDDSTLIINQNKKSFYIVDSIVQDDSNIKIDLKCKCNSLDNSTLYIKAKINIPKEKIIKDVILVSAGTYNDSHLNFVDKIKSENIIIIFEKMIPNLISELVLDLKRDPIEFINNILSYSDNKLSFNGIIYNSPELKLVVSSNDNAELDIIMNDNTLKSEIKKVIALDDSKLDII